MLCYSKYGGSQLSDVEIRPLAGRVAQVLLDFRKAVQPSSSNQMAPPQAKDQSIHATADLDLENDPRTKHKVGPGPTPPLSAVPPAPPQTTEHRASVQACVVTEADPPWHILDVNERWCELTGFTRDEVLGNTCRMLQGPATCSQAAQPQPRPAPPAAAPAPATVSALAQPHPYPYP